MKLGKLGNWGNSETGKLGKLEKVGKLEKLGKDVNFYIHIIDYSEASVDCGDCHIRQ